MIRTKGEPGTGDVVQAVIVEHSEDLGEAMVGINESEIEVLMSERGL